MGFNNLASAQEGEAGGGSTVVGGLVGGIGLQFAICCLVGILYYWRRPQAVQKDQFASLDEPASPTSPQGGKPDGGELQMTDIKIAIAASSSTPGGVASPNIPTGRISPAESQGSSTYEEQPEERQRRIAWIKYYVENNMLQEAFDLGWSGIDWRTAKSLQLQQSPIHEVAQSTPGQPQNMLKRIEEDTDDEPAGAGAVGGMRPPTSPAPSPMITFPADQNATMPSAPATMPPSGDDTESEDEEEELRRLEWIKYYVKVGRVQEAFDIGWDGREWLEQPEGAPAAQ